MANENETPQEEFDAAWDTAPGDDEPKEPLVEEPEDQEPEPSPEPEPEEELEEGPAEEEDPDYKELYEKSEHKMKSWEGRLSKTAKDLKAREDELAQLKEQHQDPEPSDTLEEKEEPESNPFREEYGDEVADYVDTRARELAKEQAEEIVAQRLTPIEDAQKKSAMEAHFQTIRDQHPDYQEVAASDQFGQWVDEQPSYLADAMRSVLQQGTAEQVNELFADYKTANGQAKKQDKTAQRQQRARKAAAVKGKAPKPPKDTVDQSYEEAWDSF